jgi:hypothetical protein
MTALRSSGIVKVCGASQTRSLTRPWFRSNLLARVQAERYQRTAATECRVERNQLQGRFRIAEAEGGEKPIDNRIGHLRLLCRLTDSTLCEAQRFRGSTGAPAYDAL